MSTESSNKFANLSIHSASNNSPFDLPHNMMRDYDDPMGLPVPDENPFVARDMGEILVPATQPTKAPTDPSSSSSDDDAEGEVDPDPAREWDYSPTSHSSKYLRSPPAAKNPTPIATQIVGPQELGGNQRVPSSQSLPSLPASPSHTTNALHLNDLAAHQRRQAWVEDEIESTPSVWPRREATPGGKGRTSQPNGPGRTPPATLHEEQGPHTPLIMERNLPEGQAATTTPNFTPQGYVYPITPQRSHSQRGLPFTPSLLARTRTSTARTRTSPPRSQPNFLLSRAPSSRSTLVSRTRPTMYGTAPGMLIHGDQPQAGSSSLQPPRGQKRKTIEGNQIRMQHIQRGLDERHNLRMTNIQRGLDQRNEMENQVAQDLGNGKGKQVDYSAVGRTDKPFLGGYTGPFGFPPQNTTQPSGRSNNSSTFSSPQLSLETLQALEKAEQEANSGPPAKRRRTSLQLRGDGPALFANTFAAQRNPQQNVANSFPRQRNRLGAGQRRPLNSHFERLAMLQSNNGTVNGDPRMHLTPPEVGKDFPYVELAGPNSLLDNVPEWVQDDWELLVANKMFLQVFGMSAHPSNPRHDAALDQLPKLICDIFDTNGIVLSRPVLEHGYHLEPNTFLLSGMDDEVRDALLAYRVFSTPQYQFFCYPYDPFFPEFLCTLENFNPSFLIKPEAEEMILRIIKRTLTELPWIDTISNIVEHENAILEDQQPKSTAIDVIDSIWIEISKEHIGGNISKPVVNVYSPSPSSRPVHWSAWKGIFHTAKFKSGIAGTGEYVRTRYCKGCHGIDHTRGLCPFTAIPGWHDDAPHAPAELANSAHAIQQTNESQRGRKNSGRGRGRGRGRGNQNNKNYR